MDKDDLQICINKGISESLCSSLIDIYNRLDREQTHLWNLADDLEKISLKEWERLNKAYTNLDGAKDWITDIIKGSS